MKLQRITLSIALFTCGFLLNLPVSKAADFFDDFNDGDALGWNFIGANSAHWSVSNGRLMHQAPGGYTGHGEFALINGWSAPDSFRMEADVTVLASNFGNDWGHVGFAWDVADPALPADSFFADFENLNTSYLRTHSDHVTSFSYVNRVTTGENHLSTPGTINGQSYHLTVLDDSHARTITISLDNHSQTFTGTQYDQINRSGSGGIGLISWKDTIAFDNVSLTVVPEPGTWALFGVGAAGALLAQRRANKRRAQRQNQTTNSQD